jgi:hypothetical protein
MTAGAAARAAATTHPTAPLSPAARACGPLPPVTTAISGPPGGPYRLRVQVGASVSVFTVTGGGDITS